MERTFFGRWQINDLTVRPLVTIIVCIIIMIALILFVQKTKPGQAMRAVSEDRGAALLMGINVNGTIALTFAIGSGLAAIAGVLLCSAYPSLTPYTGAMPGIKAFVAAVFGGIGSIPGAFIGGILLGIIEIFGKGIYFITDGRCHRVCCADRCAVSQTNRFVRQKNTGESVGGWYVKRQLSKQKISDFITYAHCISCFYRDADLNWNAGQISSLDLKDLMVPLCTYVILASLLKPGGWCTGRIKSWSRRLYVCRCFYECILFKMYAGYIINSNQCVF